MSAAEEGCILNAMRALRNVAKDRTSCFAADLACLLDLVSLAVTEDGTSEDLNGRMLSDGVVQHA